MWKKGVVTLIGCSLVMWGWINENAVMRLTLDPAVAAEASKTTPVHRIAIATDNVDAMTKEECGEMAERLSEEFPETEM